MIIKLFEVRDAATYIPIFAFRPQSDIRDYFTGELATSVFVQEDSLLKNAGFGGSLPLVIIGRLECKTPATSDCTYSPYSHTNSRTMQVAHEYIERNFDSLQSGEVIDVEFILGEKLTKKQPQRLEFP